MNSNLNIDELSNASITRSEPPKVPRIIRTHFPPDHLLSQDEAQKCYNKLQYDRSLKPHQKELIQEHLEKVEKEGVKMDFEVPENELAAWDWVKPYLRNGEEHV